MSNLQAVYYNWFIIGLLVNYSSLKLKNLFKWSVKNIDSTSKTQQFRRLAYQAGRFQTLTLRGRHSGIGRSASAGISLFLPSSLKEQPRVVKSHMREILAPPIIIIIIINNKLEIQKHRGPYRTKSVCDTAACDREHPE